MGAEVKFIIILLFLHSATATTKRCLDIEEVNPKRFVSSGGSVIPLTLGVTNRTTHRLATQVFWIFLKEVLGYADVVIKEISHENVTLLFDQMSGLETNPHYMIDLEVWIPPDFNTVPEAEMRLVLECGNLSPPGRYGWFIPKKCVPPDRQNEGIHWSVFSQIKTAREFRLSTEMENEIKDLSIGISCHDISCKNKYYTPEWCQNAECPVIIAEDQKYTNFIINDIINRKLYLKVAWIGENFYNFAEKIMKSRSSRISCPIFLTYMPNELTLEEDYISVTLPSCDYFRDTNCNYENNRLVKFAWGKLNNVAEPAYEALHNIDFKSEDYKSMIMNYIKKKRENLYNDDVIYDIACDWLKNHYGKYKGKNIHNEEDLRKTLYIGGIFPLGQNYSEPFFSTVNGIVMSSEMAIASINNNPNILRDYKLSLLLDNGECKSEIVLKKFITYIYDNSYSKLIGILGPACSETLEPLAAIATHFNTVIISYSAEGSSFVDREKYPYFYRTIGENKQYMHVYLKLFKEFKWKRAASLTEDGTKYTEYIAFTQDLFHKNGIIFEPNRKFPRVWEKQIMQQCLEEIKEKETRIIIADVDERAARAIMCLAYRKNMTAAQGYVWFLPNRPTDHWYKVLTDIDCNERQMLEAINGHFSLSHAFWAPDNNIMQENITVKEWKEKYMGELKKKTIKILDTFSNYAAYAYDAVWAYAYALDGVITKNPSSVASLHEKNTTKLIADMLEKTNFAGLSGQIQFMNGSVKFATVNIIQWVNNKSVVVGTYEPKRLNDSADYKNGELKLFRNQIVWLNLDGNKPPLDGTRLEGHCFFQGFAEFLNTDCHIAIIVANIIGLGILIFVLIIGFLIIKHRYDKKVRLTQKYMKSLGIDLLSVGPVPSLDTWEISKEKVVINRKLGEGAFGTVYGGETYFDDKRSWVAVAVKTLKVGSTTEEKLDFLSEAEVMKRFEHKNIVQLLGVCTKSEPVYTIMEFMLYGDLKTFLLARRHLVNDKYSDDNDEISSKKLTNMALDVARALSYLAELRYVHRDVASRNCLVNAQRVVKLGDFGMTRPMFENDYYKFNRKGMLPVRWMSPESLLLGVFTPASDVWSFGVLLYEIITFGSFPFQGLTNNQVLDFVKEGNTITIPTGIKPQLEGLIKSCWDREHKKRPQASEIVEFLANNPRLIVPCIDVPISSVQMDDTAQLEFSLPQDKPRKFSMTLRQRTPSSHSTEMRSWTDVSEPLIPTPNRNLMLRSSSISEDNTQIDSPL